MRMRTVSLRSRVEGMIRMIMIHPSVPRTDLIQSALLHIFLPPQSEDVFAPGQLCAGALYI